MVTILQDNDKWAVKWAKDTWYYKTRDDAEEVALRLQRALNLFKEGR